MNYCFYHMADLDGKSSGAIVKKHFSQGWDCKGRERPCEFVPFNYSHELDVSRFKWGDVVYFLDCTPEDRLMELHEIIGSGLFVIDHHASFFRTVTYDKLKKLLPMNIVCDSKYAACELVWKHFYASPVPKAIHLLGQYDSWRDTEERKHEFDYDWETQVMPFQFGMRHQEFDADKFIAEYLCGGEVNYSVEKTQTTGKIILDYQDTQNSMAMKSSFEATIKGYKCLCLNAGNRNSRVFRDRWDKKRHDFMMAFSMSKNGKWSYSFYTDREDRDASKIAAEFGGGGHKGASGCYSDVLIFEDQDA